MNRQFDDPVVQGVYEYYSTQSKDALCMVLIRLREHLGDFDGGDSDE